jgi:hypothetical protein
MLVFFLEIRELLLCGDDEDETDEDDDDFCFV